MMPLFPSLLLIALAPQVPQAPQPPRATTAPVPDFQAAAGTLKQQLEESIAELAALRERLAAEKIPLSRRLRELEDELSSVRSEHQQAVRKLDSSTLDLSNLQGDLKRRAEDDVYLANLLTEFTRAFESRLHIAETQRHGAAIEAAQLAQERKDLTAAQAREPQLALLALSLERLHESLNGARFEGSAVDPAGVVHAGTFLVVGPTALFRSADGLLVGTAEQRLGSLEPNVTTFADPLDAQLAASLVAGTGAVWPFDPTLGNAHKLEATEETLVEHLVRGGPVMIPILILAAAALLVVLIKWVSLMLVRRPSQRQLADLLESMETGDRELVQARATALPGPTGEMLRTGAEHLGEPRELLEEVMYESVLTARLRLERMLPFVAVAASSAPLLGLLGTVTGIINTFKLITLFGSGDVKTLSSGISEALITTEYGLIVAIPSLLLHALLSRKAKGILAEMEAAAMAFANQAARSGFREPAEAGEPAGDEVLVPAARREEALESRASAENGVSPAGGARNHMASKAGSGRGAS